MHDDGTIIELVFGSIKKENNIETITFKYLINGEDKGDVVYRTLDFNESDFEYTEFEDIETFIFKYDANTKTVVGY